MLRVMEYFEGILIMTTNRIKQIDLACQSRIQYAVVYHELTEEQQTTIWKQYHAQLDDSNSEAFERGEILKWIKDEADERPGELFNGREIRNVFTGAQTLSYSNRGREGMVSLKNIKEMHRATLEFRRSMERYNSEAQAKHVVTMADKQRR